MKLVHRGWFTVMLPKYNLNIGDKYALPHVHLGFETPTDIPNSSLNNFDRRFTSEPKNRET